MVNHVVDEDGRTDYARESEDGNTRKASQESTQFVLATGGSSVPPLRTPEYEVPGTNCRQSIEGGFRLGGY